MSPHGLLDDMDLGVVYRSRVNEQWTLLPHLFHIFVGHYLHAFLEHTNLARRFWQFV